MSDPDQALQKTGGDGAAVQPADFTPRSMQELQQFAETVSQSQMVPRKYQGSPQDVVVAVMHGMELGLPPLQALQSIAVINGQPSLYGDAALALVKRSGKEAWTQEWTEGEGESFTAYCETKPVRAPQPTKQHFSWQEAQNAGLLSKGGPWQDYPRRMMQMRARSWCLRDAYPEVLSGLMLAQEAEAIPNSNGATVDPNGKMGHTETQKDTSDIDYEQVHGFHIPEGHAQRIQEKSEELGELDGADLAAGIESVRGSLEGRSGATVKATEAMLDSHEQRLADQQADSDSGKATGGTSTNRSSETSEQAVATEQNQKEGSPTDDVSRYEDAGDALQANFSEAWKREENEDWDSISESQLNRLYAIAEENGWDESALNRMIKSDLGWESKADVPYGDPYNEICEALEDDRLRYHMSRDPDTPDMFDEEEQEANDEAFKDGADDDDLPF